MFNKFTSCIVCLFLFFYNVSYFGRTSITVFTVLIICIIAKHAIQVKYYQVSHFSNSVMERSVFLVCPLNYTETFSNKVLALFNPSK